MERQVYISDLFEVGLQRFHLRKPDSTASEVAKLLGQIPDIYHGRIVLHRFPELIKDFSLCGYHHYSKEKLVETRGRLVVRSINLMNFKNLNEPLDYCFFGPVYESISKKGYIPKVSLPELGGLLYNLKKGKF